MSLRYKLHVGDWSDDGHGKCDVFILESDVAHISLVRAAFHRYAEENPNIDPTGFCSDYEDCLVSPDIAGEIREKLGIEIPHEEYDGDGHRVDPEMMAEIVAAFISAGGVQTRVVPERQVPSLNANWEKDRVGSIGYGLFR